MATFQIISRTAPVSTLPQKRPKRLDPRWARTIRVFISVNLTALLFIALLNILRGNLYVFVLLPTLLSMLTVGSRRYSFSLILESTPLYTLLTFCLALVYYSMLTALVLLTHFASDTAHIILVAAALACGVIFDPVRLFFQEQIEQRFNVRNREVRAAIETFTSTLREEIDLDQVCERFLAVIQRTMRPYFVSLWVRAPALQLEPSAMANEAAFSLADDDPFVVYALRHPGSIELARVHLASPLLEDLRARSGEIALPLASQGELIGLLVLGPRLFEQRYRRLVRAMLAIVFFFSLLHWILLLIWGPRMDDDTYTHQELATLSALAAQVAPALRVAQIVREQQRQVRERERIEQELRTAQSIQKAFLPKEVPVLADWQLIPYYQPAREVGGDFYDFITLADGRLSLVVGDVTGKGVPAALVMATVLTMLRSAARSSNSPARILEQVNDLLVAEIPAGMFVTCYYVLLNPHDGQVCYANAGHEAPYRCLGGAASELWATGMPLGMLPGTRYEECESVLVPGESLLFYSDGLVEAHNPSGEMFGFPRLQRLLSTRTTDTTLIDSVLAHLSDFTGEKWEQEDDVTLLTLQRKERERAIPT
ncbi:MAG TPA: PP2C family protein-serine/threonine phosphatase [Ktedonobacteraceae bacterium]